MLLYVKRKLNQIKNYDGCMLSLISSKEWGKNGPFKKFISAVQLLADHTWKEL